MASHAPQCENRKSSFRFSISIWLWRVENFLFIAELNSPFGRNSFPCFPCVPPLPSNFLLSNLRFVGRVNAAYTQCAMMVGGTVGGLGQNQMAWNLFFPFQPCRFWVFAQPLLFLHQSLICKLFLHSTQTICVFIVPRVSVASFGSLL